MLTRNCANPQCAREFQATARNVDFCSRQCYLDVSPPSPGAFTPKKGKEAAARRWNPNRAGAMSVPTPARDDPGRDSRAALIAKVAAEMGVPVSAAEARPKMDPVQWVRHCAKVRKARKEQDLSGYIRGPKAKRGW